MLYLSAHGLMSGLEGITSLSLELCLFQSDSDPRKVKGESQLVECDFPGYQRGPLSEWVVSSPAGGPKAEHPVVEFTRTKKGEEQKVYGYYFMDGERYIGGERFDDGPYLLSRAGDSVKVPAMIGSKSVE